MDFLLSLPMSRASSPVFQSNSRGIILNKTLPSPPQCTGQAGGLSQGVCATITAKQARGTEPRWPGHILPPAASLHLLVLLPHQEDLLWASWKGQLHHSSVWFAGAMESPAKPLATHSHGCWCIYSKSWRSQWFQLLPSALGRTKPLWVWQGRSLGACALYGAGNRFRFQGMTKSLEHMNLFQKLLNAFRKDDLTVWLRDSHVSSAP